MDYFRNFSDDDLAYCVATLAYCVACVDWTATTDEAKDITLKVVHRTQSDMLAEFWRRHFA